MAITKIQSESLNLSDTYDFTGTVTGAGGANTPAWLAFPSSNPSIANATDVKITFDNEIIDTNNNFANSRFTCTVAGVYCALFRFQTNSQNANDNIAFTIKHTNSSGTVYSNRDGFLNTAHSTGALEQSNIFNMVVGDYLECFFQQYSGSGITLYFPRTSFSGFKLIT